MATSLLLLLLIPDSESPLTEVEQREGVRKASLSCYYCNLASGWFFFLCSIFGGSCLTSWVLHRAVLLKKSKSYPAGLILLLCSPWDTPVSGYLGLSSPVSLLCSLVWAAPGTVSPLGFMDGRQGQSVPTQFWAIHLKLSEWFLKSLPLCLRWGRNPETNPRLCLVYPFWALPGAVILWG